MRVPDSVLGSVVYIGEVDANRKAFHARGTGFIVILRRSGGLEANYLVTADHVRRSLQDDRNFAIKLNDRAGNAQILTSPPCPIWWKHPNDPSVDAAVYPWGLRDFPFTSFPVDRFVTAQTFQQTETTLGIGIGDEIFIVGLFRGLAGSKRITPILRHGHIAMLRPEPIRTPNYGDAQFHLVEAFTTAGLSGSPVYVHESVFFRPKRDESSGATVVGKIYFLGLVHGLIPLDTMAELSGTDRRQK